MRDTTNVEKDFLNILQAIGEDPQREGLQDTPARAAAAMDFLTSGYRESLSELVNDAIFESEMDEMVIVRDIEMYSLCEHHLLPFTGRCHVAYIPQGKVIGLSKIPRIVDMYARRLQIQEGMTREIALAVEKVTGARGVGVVVEARHMCMMMRGVQKQNSAMMTSVMLGSFREDPRTRAEFLNLLNNAQLR